MKKEKGFTLIELLAVIIILTIIALISIPLVLNIIEKTRKSAFEDSAYGIMESARLYYIENIMDNKELGDKVFSYETEENELKYSGTRPKGGTIIVKSNGKIEMAIYNNKWCAVKSEEDSKVKILNYNKETCKIESPMIEEGMKLDYIESGLDSAIPGSYYNIRNQKGMVTCINLSDENKEITNTKELKEGENCVKCRMMYENKEIASLTRTFNVDGTTPTITSPYISEAYTTTEKTSVEVSTLYDVTFGKMGGNVTCKNGDMVVTNLNTLAVGTHTLTCTATGNNGKTASVLPKVIIESEGISGNELATKDGLENLADMYRYRGENPNNWVCFGDSSITTPTNCDENHKWRIIGIDTEGRMKIMTNYYYSTRKAWDTSGGTYGNNNWGRPADLNTELNGSSFYSNNAYIDATYRGYIINATWYTGGSDTYTLQAFIDGEKSNSTTGYVGVMSMVDFGYAGSGCTLTTRMVDENNACMSNNWIGYSVDQWSITPQSDYSNKTWIVFTYGYIHWDYVSNKLVGVRPVVYLDSSVKITAGTGTESNPYILTK